MSRRSNKTRGKGRKAPKVIKDRIHANSGGHVRYRAGRRVKPAGSISAATGPIWDDQFTLASFDPTTFKLFTSDSPFGDISFLSSDGMVLPDHEGLYHETVNGDPTWYGARWVTNYAAGSDTPATQDVTVVSGIDYVVSFEGTGTVALSDATTDSLVGTSGERSALDSFVTGTTTLTLTLTGDVTNLQVEKGTVPGEYVATEATPVTSYYANVNGNTVLNNVVTEAVGAPIDTAPDIRPIGLYGAPAATNEMLYSRDLTNWTQQTGTAVSAYDAVGLTGEPNTATTLTDDDGAAYEDVRELITVPNDSNTNVLRYFISKDNDETRFPEFTHIVEDGTPQQSSVQLNTKTGALNERVSIGTTAFEVNSVDDLWELLISVDNNASGNTSIDTRVYPARGSTLGTVSAAATGSIIIGNVDLHLNKTIAEVRGTPPIFTSGTAVTNRAIEMTVPAGAHNEVRGLWNMTVTPFVDNTERLGTADSILSLDSTVGGQSALHFSADGDFISSYDKTNLTVTPDPIVGLGNKSLEVVMAYGDPALSKVVTVDGVQGDVGFYNNFNAGGDIFFLKGVNFPYLISDIQRFDSATPFTSGFSAGFKGQD